MSSEITDASACTAVRFRSVDGAFDSGDKVSLIACAKLNPVAVVVLVLHSRRVRE